MKKMFGKKIKMGLVLGMIITATSIINKDKNERMKKENDK